jgi:hypothetical protein
MSPSKDPVEAYQDGLRNLDKAKAKVEHMIAAVKDASLKLDEWDQVKVEGVNVQFNVGARTINWDNLRSGRELADALREWHKARDEANNAWKRVPPNRQIGLINPEEYSRRTK